MGLIRESALLQVFNNDDGLVTASSVRTVFGVVEDVIQDLNLDLTTTIDNIQIGTNSVGNIEEVQFKGSGNTLLSTPNFKYDVLNSILDIKQNAKFTLPLTGTKNFLITKDALSINNLLQIDSTNDIVTIGATNSTVKLQRGASGLDESLTLATDLLNLQNSNLLITSASSTSGAALDIRNLSNTVLLSVNNNGLGATVRNGFSVLNTNENVFLGGTVNQANPFCTSVGVGANVTASGGTAVGCLAQVTGNLGTAIGRAASVTGSYGVAIGQGSSAPLRTFVCGSFFDSNTGSNISDVYFAAGLAMPANTAFATIPTRFRGSDAGASTNFAGGDVANIAGRGVGTGRSGVSFLGYKQQNLVDVQVISVQEKTAASTNGKARVRIDLEIFADNAAALAGGLVAGDWYRTATGDPKVTI